MHIIKSGQRVTDLCINSCILCLKDCNHLVSLLLTGKLFQSLIPLCLMVLCNIQRIQKKYGTDVFVEYHDDVLVCFLQNMRKRQEGN